jgi:hypothetical protein
VPLTLAEIERWSAGSVRDVAAAARTRANACFDAADGLAKLPAFQTWQGDGGQAAAAAMEKARSELNTHGEEALTVAQAADTAADGVEKVQADLRALKTYAHSLHMEIDSATDTIHPEPGARLSAHMAAAAIADLQPRVAAIIGEATGVDAELASAVAMANGKMPIPTGPPHDDRANNRDALRQPLPQDPKQFHDLWQQLTQEEKDWLYDRDHLIGNHDGMPTVDRDYYNRLTLHQQLTDARTAAAQADALRNQHPDWAQGQHIPPRPTRPGVVFPDRQQYDAWQRQYTDALNRSKYLPDLQAVDKAVTGHSERKLMLLDTQTGRQARAAVAVGDPDTATHVSVTAPGLNTTVHGGIADMTSEATNLRVEALRQLSLMPGHQADTVATIAWIGYDPPQVPGLDDVGASLKGGWEVSHDDVAKAGAQNLAGFYDGLQAAHQGGPAHLTAIGHSYGSLTTGIALQEPGSHGVSDAIFYGSPGIEAATPGQLQLQPGHGFTMETPDDPIQGVYDSKPWTALGTLLPPPYGPAIAGLEASGAGDFGPNPAANPNFTHMATGPAVVADGHGGTLTLEGAHGHSDYPRWGSNSLPRTTGYNIAAVVAGIPTNAIPQK